MFVFWDFQYPLNQMSGYFLDSFGQFQMAKYQISDALKTEIYRFALEIAVNCYLSCARGTPYVKVLGDKLLTIVFEISLAQVPNWMHNGSYGVGG